MSKPSLLVLFGGVSSEHEVSCLSAATVISNINTEKYSIFPVGITKDGAWFFCPDASVCEISNGEWSKNQNNIRAALSPDRCSGGLLLFDADSVKMQKIDCVFPVLHGENGEDGTMQGFFEIAGIPYVGAGVCACAVAMDKAVTKIIAARTGVRQAGCEVLSYPSYTRAPERVISRITARFPRFPVFVKPARRGSSVGISKVKSIEELAPALEEAARFDSKILVEEFIDGQEIEVAVLGNEDPVASIVGEIVASNEFYDYNAKYIDNQSGLYIPAHISDEASENVRDAAVSIYRALGCEGMARVDFFLTHTDSAIVFNEINPIPGFTSISMYPRLFEASGIPLKSLIERLITLAFDKRKA